MNDVTRKFLALIEEEPRPRLDPTDAQYALDKIRGTWGGAQTIDDKYESYLDISLEEAARHTNTTEAEFKAAFKAFKACNSKIRTNDEGTDYISMRDFKDLLVMQISGV